MATKDTIGEVVILLLDAPLANKPKPVSPDKAGWQRLITTTVSIFVLTLQDIDDQLLKAAIVHYIATERWFPSPADIRAAALNLLHRADDTPDAFTAWSQVKRRLRGGPDLHPLAQKAIDALGGIKAFGQSDIDDESSWRARFIAAFNEYQRREAEDALTLPTVANYIDARRQLVTGSVKELAASRSLQTMFAREPKEKTHAN